MIKKIDGYEVQIYEDRVAVYKDGILRGIYFGSTERMIVLRQLVNAVRSADDERAVEGE